MRRRCASSAAIGSNVLRGRPTNGAARTARGRWSAASRREWQSLVRTESLFFAARERYETGQPFDWATLALDHGFADQSHLVRAARHIAGFSPGEFAERFAQDESFWLYRLWM